MSMAAAAPRQRGKGHHSRRDSEDAADENNHLIQCIMTIRIKERPECSQYQQMLHTNLVYLATIADSNQNMQLLYQHHPHRTCLWVPEG